MLFSTWPTGGWLRPLITGKIGRLWGTVVAPVVTIAGNRVPVNRMPDRLHLNTGTIIDGAKTIQQAGERLLELMHVIQSPSASCKKLFLCMKKRDANILYIAEKMIYTSTCFLALF